MNSYLNQTNAKFPYYIIIDSNIYLYEQSDIYVYEFTYSQQFIGNWLLFFTT